MIYLTKRYMEPNDTKLTHIQPLKELTKLMPGQHELLKLNLQERIVKQLL